MTYLETRKAVKELILKVGIDGVYNYHINELVDNGHKIINVSNALDYFRYSPKTAKYRN